MKNKRLRFGLLALLLGMLCFYGQAEAKTVIKVVPVSNTAKKISLEIEILDSARVDGIEIYRSTKENGKYTCIGNVEVTPEDTQYTFEDSKSLVGFKLYYYQIKAYQYTGGNTEEDSGSEEEGIENNSEKIYTETVKKSMVPKKAGPRLTRCKRSGKFGAKLKWTKVKGADGYRIYYMKNYDKKGRLIYPETWDYSQYKLLKTIKNGDTTGITLKNLKHGVTYTFRVCAYKQVNKKKVESVSSVEKQVTMDYYAYDAESYDSRIKRAFGSEQARNYNFSSPENASRQMTTIQIQVWDFQNGAGSQKVTKTKYLTVNAGLAPTIQQIFKEIYNSREQQVIHDIGCYSYRQGEHMYGLAIDVNANENYMIDGGQILAGSYWRPGVDPYSIPDNSEFVKIMRKYGFYRGSWGQRKDYMHFSYFGT
ncbi:MAG: M15 family metallopeptidase [Bacteroidales bacterium]|nr:M15 family metallopeptidase [Clostridium sp.]MCM1204831.1 M15 family metallopeptidase [Bacteroidales bacterium]